MLICKQREGLPESNLEHERPGPGEKGGKEEEEKEPEMDTCREWFLEASECL